MFDTVGENRAVHITLLLVPPCSALGIGALIDPLLAANRRAGRKLYDVSLLSLDGRPVPLCAGLHLPVHGALTADIACDGLIVVAEGIVQFAGHQTVIDTLARLAKRAMALGAAHAGAYWLARAGALNGYRAAIHWEERARFSEEFERVIASHGLYEIDRDRFTASGGTASLEMMLALIERHQGPELAAGLSEQFCLERVRPGTERQRIPHAARIGASQPKLTEALLLMEANIEEPLTTEEIAHYVGVSRRQLERLFKQFLDALPSRYYLELRLGRARWMLQRTAKSVVQIGLSCGFSSGPHFSTAYRGHFGITPREERSRRETQGGLVVED